MLLSKLSSKGQVTIPREIREAIRLKPGDMLTYELRDDIVMIRRVEPFDVRFHAAVSETLDEWTTAEDDQAFRDL